MAQKYSPKELSNISKIEYKKIRDFLKTGDLFFCSGGYIFSKIIQKLTKSTWSHVAIIYKDEDLGRVLVLEAEPFVGIRLIPLSKYLNDYQGKRRPYKGKIFISRISPTIPHEDLKKGISFGLDELTRPYDNWEIIRIALRILFKLGKREKNRSYICSELVRDILVKAKTPFPLHDSYISPDNIWADERVIMKYRLL